MTPFERMLCTTIMAVLVAFLGIWGSTVAEVWKATAAGAVSRVLYPKQEISVVLVYYTLYYRIFIVAIRSFRNT